MSENEKIKLKIVYDSAYEYLLNKVNKTILEERILNYYLDCKPSSLSEIFEKMIHSLKNRRGYPNFIPRTDQMSTILLDFNPHEVSKKYGNDCKQLFCDYMKEFSGQYKMDITKKGSAFVVYTKGVLDCAEFLSNFETNTEFDEFVNSFDYNEFAIASLPMILKNEIHGFGFPLACDFLKEIGYSNYPKPDVHLKEIFAKLGLVKSDNNYDIFKKIVRMANIVGKEPVIVDKIFWLIGSGKLIDPKTRKQIDPETGELIDSPNSRKVLKEIGIDKTEFISQTKAKLMEDSR